MWPGPRPVSISSGILVHPSVSQQYMSQKLGAAMPPFLGRGAGSPSNSVAWAEAYLHTNHTTTTILRPFFWDHPGEPVPSGILIHPAVWLQRTWAKNWGRGVVPLFGGKLGPHLTQCGQGQGLPPFHLGPFSRFATPTLYRQTGKRSNSIGRTVLQTVSKKQVVKEF